MRIKSKEHLEGALFGAFASLVEIEQIYTIREYEATTIRVEEVKPDVTYITLAELDEMERRLNGGGNTT